MEGQSLHHQGPPRKPPSADTENRRHLQAVSGQESSGVFAPVRSYEMLHPPESLLRVANKNEVGILFEEIRANRDSERPGRTYCPKETMFLAEYSFIRNIRDGRTQDKISEIMFSPIDHALSYITRKAGVYEARSAEKKAKLKELIPKDMGQEERAATPRWMDDDLFGSRPATPPAPVGPEAPCCPNPAREESYPGHPDGPNSEFIPPPPPNAEKAESGSQRI